MTYDLAKLTELPGFEWHCAPQIWGFDDEGLFVQPAAGTDFWQRTHYGFSADNGHFLFTRLAGDFIVSATVRSQPRHQYDQAGLMVRQDAECWIKTSAEYEPDTANRLGVVVTHHGFSDWSTQNLAKHVNEISFRVARTGSEFIVSARLAGSEWTQLRMVRLACNPLAPLAVGPYACSPKDAGFRCVFREISVADASNAK
jgi:regulation of enolase protein 1 (concanavalin A-like superfamily)